MKWENEGKGREGEERRTAGRSLAGQTLESLHRETKGEGVLPARLGEKRGSLASETHYKLHTHAETDTMVMLASYESSQHCAVVVPYLCLL